jgi:hypothetical protein
MGPYFGAVPDPNVQTAERESRSFRRIEGGKAAKAAEAADRESTPYQKSFGITLQSTGGAKFELEKHPTGPGEASPFSISSSNSAGQSTPSAGSEEAQEAPAGITKKLFRKLLRS